MSTIQRYHIGPRLSEIVVHNNTVYLAGQIADTLDLDAKGQTQEVLAAIDRLLAEVGSDKTRILSVTIYLAEMDDYDAMNAAWSAWVLVPKPCIIIIHLPKRRGMTKSAMVFT